MAGTNVGAVYLDLRLNVKELTRGFDNVGKHVGALEGVFDRFQDNVARKFSVEGFAGVFGAFDGVIERVPTLTQGFMENIDAQGMVQDALEWLTERVWGFDESVLGASESLEGMPFEALEASAYDFGGAIDDAGERGRLFGEGWREMLAGAVQSAEEANEGFGRIFGVEIPDRWQDMLGGMRDGWQDAWTGMKQAFNGIINRIISGINNMIGGLNRFQVDMPSWMGGGSFGFNIPKIPNVPALARGGIVDAPTLALVGERGREAVLPLENNTGWMADLANVLAQRLEASQAFGRGHGESNVNLYLDGRKVAEGLIEDLREVAERRDLKLAWT
ncbi:MAG: hypothetical protein FWC76_02760 [Defluviitaleaceae bacterium]|nr:hypothetical protein [Defluviitaleaceae bacterium]